MNQKHIPMFYFIKGWCYFDSVYLIKGWWHLIQWIRSTIQWIQQCFLLPLFLFNCHILTFDTNQDNKYFYYFWYNNLSFSYNNLNHLIPHFIYFSLCNKLLSVIQVKQHLMIYWTLKMIVNYKQKFYTKETIIKETNGVFYFSFITS